MITTQKELRKQFREQFPDLDFRKIKEYPGNTRYRSDTRCAFVDWIDDLARDGQISQALAERATL